MFKKFVVSTCLIVSGVSFAQNLPNGIWETEYMSARDGQPKVVIHENNKVDLYIDKRCIFNIFGAPGVCTLNLLIPKSTTAEVVHSSADGIKKVYKLKDTKFALVTVNGVPKRFLAEEADHVIYSLPVNKTILHP
ncbi:hypothetical protein [Fluviispira multicolorata]|uniref:DUF4488 domain-containing protein n=1 Tax=Fluviispira multicolorata TaxID=2654512 RepID=A0A833JCF9_9BACT|nr:hypothetical protein [Fluviispira multicolorata]KAB8029962.1 hypothetical protein GCL57_10525 [Fluviispira multicolorata]